MKTELTRFLEEHPSSYDLIVSADTLCYFGELRKAMGAAAGALRATGVMVFTVERLGEEGQTYRLEPHGRYSHAEEYVRACLRAVGLHNVSWERAVLRREAGDPVEGLVFSARA